MAEFAHGLPGGLGWHFTLTVDEMCAPRKNSALSQIDGFDSLLLLLLAGGQPESEIESGERIIVISAHPDLILLIKVRRVFFLFVLFASFLFVKSSGS